MVGGSRIKPGKIARRLATNTATLDSRQTQIKRWNRTYLRITHADFLNSISPNPFSEDKVAVAGVRQLLELEDFAPGEL